MPIIFSNKLQNNVAKSCMHGRVKSQVRPFGQALRTFPGIDRTRRSNAAKLGVKEPVIDDRAFCVAMTGGRLAAMARCPKRVQPHATDRRETIKSLAPARNYRRTEAKNG
jgi:hypothetical protein